MFLEVESGSFWSSDSVIGNLSWLPAGRLESHIKLRYLLRYSDIYPFSSESRTALWFIRRPDNGNRNKVVGRGRGRHHLSGDEVTNDWICTVTPLYVYVLCTGVIYLRVKAIYC